MTPRTTPRVVDAEQLGRRLAALPTHARVVAAGNVAVPWSLLAALDEAVAEYRLYVLNAPAGMPERDGVTLETSFVGAGMRGRPTLAYYPSRLSLVPSLFNSALPVDVVLLHTSTPRDGLVSLGVEVNILPAAIEAARARGGLVVAQMNPKMPFTYGDALLPVEDIDLAVEVDTPLPELARPEPNDVHLAIAGNVAALIGDGATLQTGIGAVPDATLSALLNRRGLRVWSEMISDGVMRLERAGALADAVVTTSFAAGSSQFYEWLDGNQRIVFARTERTNDPSLIARQPAMASINAALQVDLHGQANASFVRGAIYSGFGGQTDFVVGALHSPGGHAIVALPSWHRATDTSTIVPALDQPATSFQHSYVVTEHGAARIWGNPEHRQAHELIERAAAPRAREALLAAVHPGAPRDARAVLRAVSR